MRKTINAINEGQIFNVKSLTTASDLIRNFSAFANMYKGSDIVYIIDDGKKSGILTLDMIKVSEIKVETDKRSGELDINFYGDRDRLSFYSNGRGALRYEDIGDKGEIKKESKGKDFINLSTLLNNKDVRVVSSVLDVRKEVEHMVDDLWEEVDSCRDNLEKYPGYPVFIKKFKDPSTHKSMLYKELSKYLKGL